MSEKYKTTEKEKAYFVTFTITEWLKVLQPNSGKMIIVDAINITSSIEDLYCMHIASCLIMCILLPSPMAMKPYPKFYAI
jgi:hypothetical protein